MQGASMPNSGNGNGNGDGEGVGARHYVDAIQAQLGERVTNLGRRQTDLETEMRSGFRQMESSITSFTNETRTSIAALSTTLAERNKPQWQALSVMLAAIVAIGGLVYWPIREGQTRIDTTLNRMNETMVTRQEMDWRQARGQEDRSRMESSIADVREGLVPREEHARVWSNYDQRLADQQRQLDELKTAASSTYGARDFLLDTRERLDRLERERIRAATP